MTRRKVAVFASILICLSLLVACTDAQRQQAAQAAQDASIVVKNFQEGEILAYQQGAIPVDDHAFIQKSLITVSVMGKTLDGCIKTATNNAGIVTCANSAVATVDQLNTDGALYLKSDKAKSTFQLAMIGTKTSLGIIATIFGGK
jgi:hypothetical protein